jgi:hypothetical protein
LLTQVLALCRAAGLVRLGTVAIDGTKIAADASPLANRTAAGLRAAADTIDHPDPHPGPIGGRADRERVEPMLVEAAERDAVEDAEHGAARGDELPAGWHGRPGRREWPASGHEAWPSPEARWTMSGAGRGRGSCPKELSVAELPRSTSGCC